MKNKEEFLYFFKKILGFFEKVYMNRRTHITSFIIYIYVVFCVLRFIYTFFYFLLYFFKKVMKKYNKNIILKRVNINNEKKP